MDITVLAQHWFWYSLLTLAAMGIGILSYKRSYPPLSRFWRILLASVRALMILLLGIFLIEPLLNIYSSKMHDPKLAVLIDDSKSMGVTVEGVSRIDLARNLVLEGLSNVQYEYELFRFSNSLKESPVFPEESDLIGEATAIAGAFDNLSAKEDIDEYGAAVLITDGRQNLGGDPVAQAIKLDIPVFTLTVGDDVEAGNLSIENVVSPAVVYCGDSFEVEAEFSAEGITESRSKAFIRIGEKIIVSKPLDIPGEGRRVRIAFDIMVQEPGDYMYTVSTPIMAEETNSVDNERTFVVRVLKEKIRVFLGTSALDWEYKFIKQSLAKFDELEVAAVFPERAGRFSSPGTPKRIEGLREYDTVILVDCPPRGLNLAISDLKEYVKGGGSLIYVAGANSISDINSFEDLLPIESNNSKLLEGEFFFEPAPAKKQHAAILLDDDPVISGNIWRSLPPVGYIVSDILPAGQVLLEAKSIRKEDMVYPIVIVATYGSGRVAAIMGFPIWRSHFGSVRDEKLRDAVPKFWRNLLKWTSSVKQADNFKIVTDRKVYRLGEPVEMTGYLFDESSNPKGGASVIVSLIPAGEDTPIKDVVLTQTEKGIYTGEVSSLPAGGYAFKAVASSYGDTLGSTSGDITIEKYSLEMSSNSPDYNLTRRIAQATGGIAYTKDDFNRFAQDLNLPSHVRESHIRFKPFGMPLFLIIILVGFSLEWGLRKKFKLP